MAIAYNKFPEWQGCLSNDQRKYIKNHLATLDKVNGGIFSKPKRRITVGNSLTGTPDTAVLFISFGGTGIDALYALKQRLATEIDAADFKNKIRFLAVDSEASAQFLPGQDPTNINAKKRFEENEFLWLDNTNAKYLLNDSSTDKWINAGLKNTINATPTMLAGNGASNTRQVGRVLMLANASALEQKVAALTHQLTNGINAYLQVFIVTGVSGGTGSGIIIDASYIIREAVFKAFNQKNRTRISGMLLLPPTGTDPGNATVVENGNRNGYATLKEIDHFMTIANRGEKYSQVFGPGLSIESDSPIYDTCFLFDGNLTRVSLHNPRQRAIEAMNDSIIDMITAMTSKDAGQEVQPIEAILSDIAPRAKNFVEMSDPKIVPRDANYIYCTLGYGKTVIPSDLIKAYVANNVYAFMYNNVYRNYNPNPQALAGAAEAFEDQAMLDYREFTPGGQANAFNAVIEQIFKTFGPGQQGGPFYVVNLLEAVAGSLQYQRDEIASKALVIHKAEKLQQLNWCIDYLNGVNRNIFGVLAQALEEMKGYLMAESKKLFNPDQDINSYEYLPIDFTTFDERTEAVVKFLDNLVPPAMIQGIANSFANQLWLSKEKWAAIANPQASGGSAFSGSREFSEFWENSIGKKVEAELENLLIKYVAKTPSAHYYEVRTESNQLIEAPEIGAALNEASVTIASKMFGPDGKSVPRLALDVNIFSFYEGKQNSKTYFFVPESCEHVKEHLESVQKNNIVSSTAVDTISCLTVTSGIPAFLASWTKTAEPQYERAIDIGAPGLHMTETKLTDNWAEFPNLLPETIWNGLNGYKNVREKVRADVARDYFFKAKELGFAKANKFQATKFSYYDIIVLKEEFRPEIELLKAAEYLHKDTPDYKEAVKAIDDRCEELAQQLFNNKELWQDIITDSREFAIAFDKNYPESTKTVSLTIPNTVITYPLPANNPEPDPEWAPELAADLLRTWPELLKEVRGTVMVMEKVYAKVIKAQKSSTAIMNFAKYLALDLIKYDEEAMFWSYFDAENGEQVLWQMDWGIDIQEQIKHYILFTKYFEDFEKVDEALKDALLDETNVFYLKPGPEYIGKLKELAAKGDALKAKIELYASNDRENPIKTVKFKKLCTDEGFDSEAVAKFYKELYAAAGRPMFVKVAL